MKNKKSNKIKAGVLITIFLLVITTILVSATQTTIYSKDDKLPPLGGSPGEPCVAIAIEAVPLYQVEVNMTDAADGHLFESKTNYAACHDSDDGSILDGVVYLLVGQLFVNPLYFIYRSCVFFNTTSIPANADIVSAKITLVLRTNGTNNHDFDIVIYNGQPTYPHKPLVSDDYLYTHYSGDGGSFNTTNLPGINSSFDINLNAVGKSWINKSGITKLMFRSSRDINSILPTEGEHISVYSREEGPTYEPKFVVTYSIPKGVHILGDVWIGGN